MKYNCDKRRDRRESWHLIFAWLPKRIGHGDCRWLEYVWAKATFYSYYDDCGYDWEYRPKENPPNSEDKCAD